LRDDLRLRYHLLARYHFHEIGAFVPHVRAAANFLGGLEQLLHVRPFGEAHIERFVRPVAQVRRHEEPDELVAGIHPRPFGALPKGFEVPIAAPEQLHDLILWYFRVHLNYY